MRTLIVLSLCLLMGCQSARPATAKVTPGKSIAGSEVRDDGPRSERTTIKAKRTHPPTSAIRIRIIERKAHDPAPVPVASMPSPAPAADHGSPGQGGDAGGSVGPAAGDGV